MGCLQSKKRFVVNHLQGQDESALEIFTYLGLSEHDIDLLYRAFWDIDADGSGAIRPIELFSYFEMEDTAFERGIFSIFDDDHSGLINFMEFVCALWNLLTLPESSLGSIAFHLKDATGKGALRYSQVKSVLEIMHKKKVSSDPSLQTVYQQFKRDYEGFVTINQFCDWTTKNPSVTFPLVMLQLHLRIQIIGEQFWEKMTKSRMANAEQGSLDFVTKLMATVVEKNSAHKKRLADLEAARLADIRRGKGIEGDCRDNVARKESILLKYFDLKRSMSFRKRDPRKGVYADVADAFDESKATQATQQTAANASSAKGHSPTPLSEQGDVAAPSDSRKDTASPTGGHSSGASNKQQHQHQHHGGGHKFNGDSYKHDLSHKNDPGATTVSHKGHVNREYYHGSHKPKHIDRDEHDPFRVAEEEAVAAAHHHGDLYRKNKTGDGDSSEDEAVVVPRGQDQGPPRKRRSIHSKKPDLLRAELASGSKKKSSKKGKAVSPAPAAAAVELTDTAKARRNGVGDKRMT